MSRRTVLATTALVLCLAIIPGQMDLASSAGMPPCGYGFHIDIVPGLATQDDSIQVTYSAEWSSSCVPYHQSHQVMGGVIRLDAVHYSHPGQMCAWVILPWGGSATIGTLPTGTYRVDVYITEIFTPTALTSALCGTTSFRVYEELQTVFLPVISKVDVAPSSVVPFQE